MKNVKMTNKVALEFVLGLDAVKGNAEVFEKLTKMLEQVEKKNSSVGKDGKKVLSATQKANEGIKELILEELGKVEEPKQIKELIALPVFAEKSISNQKMSALLKQLLVEGKVERTEVKKVALFGLAE